jgi:hypothetical protein
MEIKLFQELLENIIKRIMGRHFRDHYGHKETSHKS